MIPINMDKNGATPQCAPAIEPYRVPIEPYRLPIEPYRVPIEPYRVPIEQIGFWELFSM
jgi:hypothetical protein